VSIEILRNVSTDYAQDKLSEPASPAVASAACSECSITEWFFLNDWASLIAGEDVVSAERGAVGSPVRATSEVPARRRNVSSRLRSFPPDCADQRGRGQQRQRPTAGCLPQQQQRQQRRRRYDDNRRRLRQNRPRQTYNYLAVADFSGGFRGWSGRPCPLLTGYTL